METLVSVLIGLAVTFFFLRRYLKGLTPAAKKSAAPAAAAGAKSKSVLCPRCGKPVVVGSSFCPACGAAMALWNIQSAPAAQSKVASAAATGKPRPVINATLCIGCGSCVDECPETGTLEIVGGKAILANAERCTGHAKCVQVCPTSAITLAFGNVLQTVRVPRVSENFETNVRGVFIVGELGGMGLIKTAVNEGHIVIDRIRAEISPAAADRPDAPFDIAIIGAGPAGLSAALTALQNGFKYLALEQGDIASTIRQYPRQKFLMAEPIQMPLYGSLYVADGTKEALLGVWESIVANTGVNVKTNERVESVRKTPDGNFMITTVKGVYTARRVVLALGKRGVPRQLAVAGEELAKVSYRLIEAETYEDRDILVVGGGDSAIEGALALSKAKRNRVTLSHRRDTFERARDRNRSMLAEAERDGRVSILRSSQIREIRQETVRLTVNGEARELKNDYVFVLIGGESPEEFLVKTGVEIVEKQIGEMPCIEVS